MRQLLFLLILLFGACTSKHEIALNSINNNDLAKDIIVLSADSLQGRAPFTVGERRTVAYLEKRMKEIGLEPAFNGKYTQGVPMVELTSLLPDNFVIQTPRGTVSLKSGDDYTAKCPVLQEEIKFVSSEIVFAGFGINAPEKGWNDFEGLDVKGKTIFVLVNDPDYYTNDTALFNGKPMTYQGRWRYKFEEAEKQGAAACFVIHEEGGAGYPWSVSSLRTNKPDFDIDDCRLISPKCLITGWITKDAAENFHVL